MSSTARQLVSLGLSHHTAPVAVRERLAFAEAQAARFETDLVTSGHVEECVVISTCNRSEFYLVAADAMAAESELLARLAVRTQIRPTELAAMVYSPRNCDAARQLFRVTSGLDSMIVGEAEIQGQVKRAYETALSAGTTGPLTNRLFTAALSTGKRVRTETEIGAAKISLSTVAVEVAGETVGELRERRVLILGAGEMAELTARALADVGVTSIFVSNRHAARARSMAERFGGTVVSFDDLPAQLLDADIVVSSTASPHPIVGFEELEVVMEQRGGQPLVLIDIAVPRDIEPACGDVPGVTLLDIDDLQRVVDRNLSVRESERAAAEQLVEEEIVSFARWMGQLDVRPTISALREHGDAIVAQVLDENSGRFEALGARDRARVEAMTRAVMQRLLHEPTLQLRGLSDSEHGSGHGRLQLVRELFGLDQPGGTVPQADERPGEGGATVTALGDRRR